MKARQIEKQADATAGKDVTWTEGSDLNVDTGDTGPQVKIISIYNLDARRTLVPARHGVNTDGHCKKFTVFLSVL